MLVVLVLLAASLPARPAAPSAPVVGILGATPAELRAVEEQMANRGARRVRGLKFVTGVIHGRKVVAARTGIGKANAAMVTALLIALFRPSEVIFTGVAGGLNPELAPGDIVIGEKVAYHDYGFLGPNGLRREATVNPVTDDDNPRFFRAEQRLLDAAVRAVSSVKLSEVVTSAGRRKPRVVLGSIATGDVFVAAASKASEIREALGADVVEMEGAAVAQVCSELGVPCLVIRSVSDRASESARAEMAQFLETAAGNAARLTLAIIRSLGSGPGKMGR